MLHPRIRLSGTTVKELQKRLDEAYTNCLLKDHV